MSDDPLLAMRLHHFENLLGQELAVDFGGGEIAATITETRALAGHPGRPDGGFSVSLQVSVPSHPQQGTFRVKHPELGAVDMFMSPRKFDGVRAVYEIIVN